MKTIRINGVDQEFSESNLALGEFINSLNQTLANERKVISRVLIDGQELSEDEEKNYSKQNLDAIGSIELEISNPADLAYETLNTLDQYVDRLIQSVDRASQLYRAKNYIGADAHFAKAIDGLDLFVQTIGGIKLALRVGLNPKIALTEAALVSIMNDLLEAKRQNNYVFMSELLERDLIENLKEWKDTAFGIFRSQNSV